MTPRRRTPSGPLSRPYRERGPEAVLTNSAFTLIEMLVATVLSAVLMLAVLTMTAGVARDRALIKALDRPTPTAVLDLLEFDLRAARTAARGPGEAVVLTLVGNGGLRHETLEPDGRLVRVVYRRVGPALWREQEYLDDPVRPGRWAELVSGHECGLTVDLPADDRPAALPARVRVAVAGGGAVQSREVTR